VRLISLKNDEEIKRRRGRDSGGVNSQRTLNRQGLREGKGEIWESMVGFKTAGLNKGI